MIRIDITMGTQDPRRYGWTFGVEAWGFAEGLVAIINGYLFALPRR